MRRSRTEKTPGNAPFRFTVDLVFREDDVAMVDGDAKGLCKLAQVLVAGPLPADHLDQMHPR